ncbi:SusC/RagA family TonB-linked outer membrane protein [Bacteroidia bacterium]|nr:SusC/RagA family TonB-linked outer membrane protein [Bacteroidia bacterium]
MWAQNVSVSGVITDETGAPMPGVAIALQGSTRGVTTDPDGTYKIEVPQDGTLVMSFLGYESQTIAVNGQRKIDVQLKPKGDILDEVTVVAFGTQKKSSVIASIETVKTSTLKVASSNLTTAFAGKIPGIISYQTSGEPGADNAQFFVRGVTTFGYKAEPLILIDGFEASSDDLARMQPDDIESFSILKDAVATALYGARGANGIILVNTKPGHEGKARINIRVDMNVSQPTKIPQMLNGTDYMRLYNEARISRDSGLGYFYDEQKIQSTLSGENPMVYPNVDWYNALFNKQTYNTKANLNISGGGQIATYYVSGGYDKESGLLKVDNRNNFNNNIDIDRFHLRTNVIFKLSKTSTLDTRISGRFERFTGPYVSASNIFRMVMNANPVDFPAVFAPDEANLYTKHTLFGNAFTDAGMKGNPYAEMVRGYQDKNESTVSAQATFLQDLDFITENLKFQAKGSVNTWSIYSSSRTYLPFYYAIDSYNQVDETYKLFALNPTGGQSYLGDVEPGRDGSLHYYFEGRLNWNRKFGDHSIGLMTVGMVEENLVTGGNSRSIYSTLPERNMGNSGRLAYDYDERYFVEFAYGYNGSEKFTGEKQYGFFPSIGAGWLASNESFWAPMKDVIGTLKFKFTYGLVGNDAIAGRAGRFWFLSDITAGSGGGYIWGRNFMTQYGGYRTVRYANEDITWEVSTKSNLGLELGLFKDDALKLQVDFYRDVRDKIYMERENLTASAGFEAPISGNVGKAQSQGIDASIDYKQFFGTDLWVTGRANMTYAVNKYLRLDEKNYADEYLKHVGQNINQGYGLIAERLFVDNAEVANSPKQDFGVYMAGDIKYKDINGDGVVTANDFVPIGYPIVPEIQYGFGLSSGFKNFDLSFFFQGNARVSVFIDPLGEYTKEGATNYGIAPFEKRRNALAIIGDNHWSETNPDPQAFWPRLSTGIINNNQGVASTWWTRDASFLRLKSAELGYTFTYFRKFGLESGRVYFSAENLFVVSPFKMWDPEMGANGLAYPLSRKFNVGLQLSF